MAQTVMSPWNNLFRLYSMPQIDGIQTDMLRESVPLGEVQCLGMIELSLEEPTSLLRTFNGGWEPICCFPNVPWVLNIVWNPLQTNNG